jgi:hypothetical protein
MRPEASRIRVSRRSRTEGLEMAYLDFTYEHMRQLSEIAYQRGLTCRGCEADRLVPRYSSERLSIGKTRAMRVPMVCKGECDDPVRMWVRLNGAGDLEPYEPGS